MTQTLAGLLAATSLAVGLCVYRRRGLSATLAVVAKVVSMLAVLLLAAQLKLLGTLRDVLANAARWAMLSLTVQCLLDIVSAHLRSALRLALQTTTLSAVLALMTWPHWVAAPAMMRPLLVAVLIAGESVSLAPLAADYTPQAWARAVARFPRLTSWLGITWFTDAR
jgi:hypothetical protein